MQIGLGCRRFLAFALGVTSCATAGPNGSPADRASLNSKLLIVAPAAFGPALQGFVRHKQSLLPTELLSLEAVLQQSAGADDPEKLKHFLYRQWHDQHLGYVLLVGDVDVMPVRYMVLDRVTPAAFDYSFYPSDLYYADLAKQDGSFEDWNANKDSFHAGYYGEVRGEKNKRDPINFDEIDYRPEIAVGRWPVSTVEEVSRIAAKTMAYEQNLLTNHASQLHRAAFVAVGGWVDSRGLLDKLSSELSTGWSIQKRFYHDQEQTGQSPAPDHQQVRGLLNDGVGLVVHAGHGAADAWEQCFSTHDLDQLTNSLHLPVFISAGCSTAYFAPLAPYDGYVDVDGKEHNGTDHQEVFTAPPPPPNPYQRGRFNPTGLGEQILKHSSNGGVAYIGCNTGSQPCALTLLDGFVVALAKSKEPRLGDCWSAAIRYYYDRQHLAELKPNDDWYPPSIFFQGMKFMVFGDPSLRLPGNRS